MGEPTVSVAMATYNGERFLQEQLDSLARQTLLPSELVVCDDCSTDGTLGILRNFQSTAPFEVKLHINGERFGYTRNFEKALSLCSGDVIFICDQDDVWFPIKIEHVISHFVAHPRTMVIVNDQIIADDKLSPNGVTLLQSIRLGGLNDSRLIAGCSTAIRREWRDLAIPIPADDVVYDHWINKLADLLGARVVLPEPLQSWRRHFSNATAFPLSRQRYASLFANVRVSILRDVRPLLLKEAHDKKVVRQWLETRDGLFRSFHLEDAKEKAAKRLDRDIRVLEKRIGLVDLPRGLRMAAAARFLMEGGYTNFSGWKSALRDVLS